MLVPIMLGMVVGAAAGSTVGGLKLIRAATVLKGIRFRIADDFYPGSVVRRLPINGRRLDGIEASREFEEAAIVSFLWLVFLAVGVFVLLAMLPTDEFALENVLFEVASAQGSVGLSAGIVGPGMPALAKTLFVVNLWIGRLEIIPVLVLIRSIFERGGLYR